MEKKFVQGLFINKKDTQFGEILKLSIRCIEFKNFITENTNEKGYVNIDILTTKDGKKYAVLNEFKPQSSESNQHQNNNTSTSTVPEVDDDLPF